MIENYLRTYTNRFLSSYLILLTDTVIALVAFIIAFGLRFNFDVSAINGEKLLAGLLITTVSRLICFVRVGSYRGIIRHTSLEDLRLLGLAVTLSTALTALISGLLALLSGQWQFYVPVSILLIDYFCCLVILAASRFGAKTLYWHVRLVGAGGRQPVLIYGAGKTGLLTRKALEQDSDQWYQMLAFIDDDPAKRHKVIEGVEVLSRQQAYQRFIQGQTKLPQVILAMESISPHQRTQITDFFLSYQISVRTVPGARQWMNGRFDAVQIRDIRIEDLLERAPIHLGNSRVSAQLDEQVVMVTGAAGSIGSELVRQLLSHRPHTIVLVDQAESALFDLEFQLRQQFKTALDQIRLVIKIADVSNQVRMQHVFRDTRPTLVFHAAAYKHVPLMEEHPFEAVRVNVLGTQVMADLALEYDVQRFVMISTDKAVNPTNVMGATKRLAELYVQSLNHSDPLLRRTRFMITRFGNVLGSNGSVVTVFRQQIQAGGPVTVTHPDIQRYFMTIPESCQLVLEAGAMGHGGEVFVFDMGEPVRIVDLARKMIRLSREQAGQEIKIVFTGLRPGEKLSEELLHAHERTLPTHHPKIVIARVAAPHLEEIRFCLEQLRYQLAEGNDRALVSSIKRIIPEFISNNSVFSTLDY
ncbi:nucleoside-diphosphate sugar epimerase/dehydratase [Larkinella knui]|uniref:Polysaccharide biosynthesis protein n=1 Tax=Larkinella knui TaxID=2025310 RepID=A0A3P1CUQ1_9BACT|nr:nucleoside-diphosphate sugar epimerase/dehydratase [Larkinella knui]RRB16830.1 polysaccharide biosynthesis protein [Larkinella knui]